MGGMADDGGRTDGWNSRDNLAELQFVQDGGLPCCVEANLVYRARNEVDVPIVACDTETPRRTISIPGW
jgi:hypothetical protein